MDISLILTLSITAVVGIAASLYGPLVARRSRTKVLDSTGSNDSWAHATGSVRWLLLFGALVIATGGIVASVLAPVPGVYGPVVLTIGAVWQASIKLSLFRGSNAWTVPVEEAFELGGWTLIVLGGLATAIGIVTTEVVGVQ